MKPKPAICPHDYEGTRTVDGRKEQGCPLRKVCQPAIKADYKKCPQFRDNAKLTGGSTGLMKIWGDE